MSSHDDRLLDDLTRLIQTDQIRLPSLPEVAVRARDVARRPDASAAEIVLVISSDPAIAARILKVANSPLMRGPREIRDLHTAIARLGLTCICNLVTSLAMEQMFRARTETVDRAMRQCWQHSTDVAGIAQVLCQRYTPHLQPDQALLAGMLHQIGALPILTWIDEHQPPEAAARLDAVIERLHPTVGTRILENWHFPDDLIQVPGDHLSFDRNPASADYADLVTVANLHARRSGGHALASVDTDQVLAFQRIGLTPPSLLQSPELNAEFRLASDSLR